MIRDRAGVARASAALLSRPSIVLFSLTLSSRCSGAPGVVSCPHPPVAAAPRRQAHGCTAGRLAGKAQPTAPPGCR